MPKADGNDTSLCQGQLCVFLVVHRLWLFVRCPHIFVADVVKSFDGIWGYLTFSVIWGCLAGFVMPVLSAMISAVFFVCWVKVFCDKDDLFTDHWWMGQRPAPSKCVWLRTSTAAMALMKDRVLLDCRTGCPCFGSHLDNSRRRATSLARRVLSLLAVVLL